MITGRSRELLRLGGCWEQGTAGPSGSTLAKMLLRDQEGFGIEYPGTKETSHLQEVGERFVIQIFYYYYNYYTYSVLLKNSLLSTRKISRQICFKALVSFCRQRHKNLEMRIRYHIFHCFSNTGLFSFIYSALSA